MITLRQLSYFIALSDTGHFGQAAERCHVSQPALSMQIQELESLLGLQLVERQRGKALLTADGQEVAQRARKILAEARDLEAWSHHRQCLVGQLRLGVIPTVAPYLLPQLLPRLEQHYPTVDLSLQESQTEVLLQALLAGDLDVLLLALPVELTGLQSLALFEDTFWLAIHRDAPLAAAETVEAQHLAAENLLLLAEGHCLRDQALGFCHTVQPEIIQRFGASSLTTIMQMVAHGHGVTLLPAVAAPHEARDERIRLLPFRDPAPSRQLGLVWRQHSPREQDFRTLGALIQEAREQP